MTAAACALNLGTVVRRAETREQCLRFQGCFDEDMNINTAVDRAQCTNSDVCDPDQYEWKTVLSWTDAVWYMHMYMHACMHTSIHTCMHACTHLSIHACMHAYIHTYIHTYIHACMHTYMHACMHACMHAYMHT